MNNHVRYVMRKGLKFESIGNVQSIRERHIKFRGVQTIEDGVLISLIAVNANTLIVFLKLSDEQRRNNGRQSDEPSDMNRSSGCLRNVVDHIV